MEQSTRGGRTVGRRGSALLVEPDEEYAVLTVMLLRRSGWDVQQEISADEALVRLRGSAYAVALVDASLLVSSSGRPLLTEIYEIGSVLVIALSHPEASAETLRHVMEHADYELIKPFSPRRFRAALYAVVHRGRLTGQRAELPAEVRAGDLSLSSVKLEVSVGGRGVELSPRQFSLLHFLLAHPGTVFTREELARWAWGWSNHGESRALDNAIRRLRQKIEANPQRPRYVITERGVGYRFVVP